MCNAGMLLLVLAALVSLFQDDHAELQSHTLMRAALVLMALGVAGAVGRFFGDGVKAEKAKKDRGRAEESR